MDDILGNTQTEPAVESGEKLLKEAEMLAKKAGVSVNEDSEMEMRDRVMQAAQQVSQQFVPTSYNYQEPNYNAILEIMNNPTEPMPIYKVTNTSERPLAIDWDRELMPKDMHREFEQYLSREYVAKRIQLRTGVRFQDVIVKIQGNVINFLENFIKTKNIPTIVAKTVGVEIQMKPQFVIHGKESVLMTEPQLASLKRYRKTRDIFDASRGGGKSDWKGFLIFTELKTEEEIKAVKYSFCTFADVMKKRSDVSPEEFIAKVSQYSSGNSGEEVATE